MVSKKIFCLVKSTKQSPLQSSADLFDRMTIFTWNGGAEMSHVLFIHLHDPCFLVHSFLLYQRQKQSNKNSINNIKRIKNHRTTRYVLTCSQFSAHPAANKYCCNLQSRHFYWIYTGLSRKRVKLHTSFYISVSIS